MNEEKNLEAYLEELDAITPLNDEQNILLVEKIVSGDEDSINQLIEGNLYIVPLRVREFLDSGIPVGDLIQEGNSALVDAVTSLSDGDLPKEVSYVNYFADLIDVALQGYIALESSSAIASRNIKEKANSLLQATIDFEEENGRSATIEELSKITNMSKEDIETVLRISYAAMENGDVSED